MAEESVAQELPGSASAPGCADRSVVGGLGHTDPPQVNVRRLAGHTGLPKASGPTVPLVVRVLPAGVQLDCHTELVQPAAMEALVPLRPMQGE